MVNWILGHLNKIEAFKNLCQQKLLQYFWDCKTPEVIPNLSHKLTWWDANPCSVCAQCLKKHGLVHQKARAKQRQKEHETMSDGIPKLFLQKWENIKHHIIHAKTSEFSVFIKKRTSTFENEKQAHACLQHGANLDAAPSQSYAQRSPREHPLVLQLVGECRWLWSLWKKSAAMSWKM